MPRLILALPLAVLACACGPEPMYVRRRPSLPREYVLNQPMVYGKQAIPPYSFADEPNCFAGNPPRPLDGSFRAERDRLQIIVQRDEPRMIAQYQGFRVVLANLGDETARLPCTPDGRLLLFREARLGKDGPWRRIEDAEASFLVHRSLEPFHYYDFVAPRLDGAMPVTLRFVIVPFSGGEPVVSKEFNGRIDPDRLTASQPGW